MILAICGGLVAVSGRAATPEPLDAEFLDYLVAVEGQDDNWTIVANEKERKKVAVPPPVKAPAKPPLTTDPPRQQEDKP